MQAFDLMALVQLIWMVVYILKSIFVDDDFNITKLVDIAVRTFMSIVLCAVTAVILSWAITKIGFTPKYIVEGILIVQFLFRAREYVIAALTFLFAWITTILVRGIFVDILLAWTIITIISEYM